jgi:hypothetical protein
MKDALRKKLEAYPAPEGCKKRIETPRGVNLWEKIIRSDYYRKNEPIVHEEGEKTKIIVIGRAVYKISTETEANLDERNIGELRKKAELKKDGKLVIAATEFWRQENSITPYDDEPCLRSIGRKNTIYIIDKEEPLALEILKGEKVKIVEEK